jgi:CPA2 family monovalent cation:H+ antiporter-2
MEGHDAGLVSTLVVSLVFAFLGGAAARVVRLPPLVGYLLAGVAVGPFTPGFVADQRIASELAEVGDRTVGRWAEARSVFVRKQY